MQGALPGQIMLLADIARGFVQKAVEEQSIEKIRDILSEIKETLDAMIAAASDALSEEEDGNAHRS